MQWPKILPCVFPVDELLSKITQCIPSLMSGVNTHPRHTEDWDRLPVHYYFCSAWTYLKDTAPFFTHTIWLKIIFLFREKDKDLVKTNKVMVIVAFKVSWPITSATHTLKDQKARLFLFWCVCKDTLQNNIKLNSLHHIQDALGKSVMV